MSLSALPSEGYRGTVPDFPLPSGSTRELELWASIWRSPQACAWAIQPWRHYSVAQWVRWSVRCEDKDTSASAATPMLRLADQIGLSPAGLKENGWAIATDEVAARASKRDQPAAKPAPRRLRAASSDGSV